MLNHLYVFLLLIPLLAASQQRKRVSGKVTDAFGPLENVDIYLEGTGIGTTSDSDGRYSISVIEESILSFSYQGKEPQYHMTSEIGTVLNVIMVNSTYELEEVVVEKSRITYKSQNQLFDAYNVDKDIISGKFQFTDKKVTGYQIEIREGDEINTAAPNIIGVLQSMFGGIKVFRSPVDYDDAVIFMRSPTSGYNPAVYEVDGVLYYSPPRFININNIKRIAKIPGLAATNLYGSVGAGGVFIINTKSGNTSPTAENLSFRRAHLAEKVEKVEVLSRERVEKNRPSYLNELYEAENFMTAKRSYNKNKKGYDLVPHFHLDAYQFFFEETNQTAFADSIVSKYHELPSNNISTLKALAFIYESQGRFDKENEIVKKIFTQNSQQLHSYLMLANSFSNLSEPKKAMSIYARYEYLLGENFLLEDTKTFSPIIELERNNIIALNKDLSFDNARMNEIDSNEKVFEGARMVFEWNDLEAEFELQFVNPYGLPFSWEHTYAANPEDLYREKSHGFSVKEFLLDGSIPGIWGVNVNYLGNPSSTPIYLKVTIYDNYNLPSQTKMVKTYKLDMKNINQELFQFNQ